jgi:hypothetical protein
LTKPIVSNTAQIRRIVECLAYLNLMCGYSHGSITTESIVMYRGDLVFSTFKDCVRIDPSLSGYDRSERIGADQMALVDALMRLPWAENQMDSASRG